MANVPISNLPVATVLRATDVSPWVVSGTTSKVTLATIRATVGGNFVTPQEYGAIGNGIADDTTAVQDANDAAAALGAILFFPAGTYLCTELTISDGVTWQGEGVLSIIKNCHITATGSVDAEIPFTAPASKGATSISIPATGLGGSWLRLSSCINANSTDAGVDQLGHTNTDLSYLSEFARIKTGNLTTADLQGATIWPYSNTPGPDSGAATTSVARVVTFHTGARLKSLTFLGENTGDLQQVELQWCRDFVIEDCTFDTNDTKQECVTMTYCLDCHVRGGTMIGQRTNVILPPTPGVSLASILLFYSSQNCDASGVSFYYGFQCIDVSYVSSATYRGGPCIACGAVNCIVTDAGYDALTSHWGSVGSFFVNNTMHGSTRGIRVRDRGAQVLCNRLIGTQSSGVGVLVDNAAAIDSSVIDNSISGYTYGIEYANSDAGYTTLQALLGIGMCEIASNHIVGGDPSIFLDTAQTSATLVGPYIHDNIIRDPTGQGIYVFSYNNGTRIARNTISGIGATKGAIRWGENISRLWIGDNHIYNVNAAGYAIYGPGTGAFMTDAITFPTGEAAAALFIGQTFTTAANLFTGILRDNTAYLTPGIVGWQPFTSGIGNAAPTLDRSSLGIYLSGSQPYIKTVNDTGGTTWVGGLVLHGTSTPEGSVAAGRGTIFVNENGGAGTTLYVKESASGNTGWAAK